MYACMYVYAHIRGLYQGHGLFVLLRDLADLTTALYSRSPPDTLKLGAVERLRIRCVPSLAKIFTR